MTEDIKYFKTAPQRRLCGYNLLNFLQVSMKDTSRTS